MRDNALQSSLPNNKFDIISCAYGLKTFNQSQINTLASQVYRLLKPGGKFSFVEVSVPDNKLLRFLYGFYLGKVIPLIGNSDDYKMLWQYTSGFGNSKKVCEAFNEAGLKVTYVDLFGGCASCIYGVK